MRLLSKATLGLTLVHCLEGKSMVVSPTRGAITKRRVIMMIPRQLWEVTNCSGFTCPWSRRSFFGRNSATPMFRWSAASQNFPGVQWRQAEHGTLQIALAPSLLMVCWYWNLVHPGSLALEDISLSSYLYEIATQVRFCLSSCDKKAGQR